MKELRTGVTTGSCAAAAAKAAAVMLFSGSAPDRLTIRAKTGAVIEFDIAEATREDGAVTCAVVKDAGDDPDVTDGIKICAAVSKTASGVIEIDGGEGVGRVTRPGLKAPVGSAAINPVPMEMIKAEVGEVCGMFSYTGGARVVISVPNGAEIAAKTMNERLGVVGGLSILGTSGIVEPMSERAVVDTIKTVIDVRLAAGDRHLLVTPGNYGRDFAKDALRLDIGDAVKCSNFIGETLDYACMKGVEGITLIGHAGKLVKLAGGVMNTHSRVADCRMEIIAAHCAMAGADAATVHQIMGCVTVEAAIGIMLGQGINGRVWTSIGERIGFHLRERTRGELPVEFIVFTQEHGVLTHSAES